MSPYVIPPSPRVASNAPPGSSPGFCAGRLSFTRSRQIASTAAAMGALRKKMARHERCCASQPPSTGPAADVSAENADQLPMAAPRSVSS